MPRKDPALLPALEVVTETITVSDPRIPGETFDFILAFTCQDSESDAWFISDKASRFEAEYVGDGSNAAKRITVNGQFVLVERQLCLHIAMLTEAEILATGESWSFAEWAIWKHKAPGAFHQLVIAYQELFYRARPEKRPRESNKVDAGGIEDTAEDAPLKNA